MKGRRGGGGHRALPRKRLSKITSFSRKNTPFDTLKMSLGRVKLRVKLCLDSLPLNQNNSITTFLTERCNTLIIKDRQKKYFFFTNLGTKWDLFFWQINDGIIKKLNIILKEMKITSFGDYLYTHPYFDTFTKVGVLEFMSRSCQTVVYFHFI